MTAPAPQEPATASPLIRRVSLPAGGIALSGLLATPVGPRTGGRAATERPVVVAIHGRSMRAGYFHGRAHDDVSLLRLAARNGYTVLALDRPGYGASARQLPEGQTLAEQAATLHAALRTFASSHPVPAGFAVIAHSYGGKVGLRMAADDEEGSLVALDISGCGLEYGPQAAHFPSTLGSGASRLHWGPLHLYPPGTFQASRALLTPTPSREAGEVLSWPRQYPRIARRITVPVRLTFAEHEHWWRLDEATLSRMTRLLTSSPAVQVARQPGAGHNISLGWAARDYHLSALRFLSDTGGARAAQPVRP